MAGKKKPTRRKSKNNRQKLDLAPGIGREIGAVLLLALALLLIIAAFGGGGFLLEWLLMASRRVLGLAAYLLPLLLASLAYQLFRSEDQPSSPTYVGMLLVLIAAAGLSHLPVSDSRLAALAGEGGGFSGYLLRLALLSIFNMAASVVALFAMAVIGLMLFSNLKLSAIITWFKERWANRKPEDSFARVADQMRPSKMTINAQVPLVNSATSKKEAEPTAPREDRTVLTTAIDPDWALPPIDLLEDKRSEADAGSVEENAKIIKSTLESFGINVEMEEVNVGPTVTQYTLKPPSGVKLSRITELDQNLAHDLAANNVRIEAPIPGRSAVGIEVPNRKTATVRLREIFQTDAWLKNKEPLSFVLGRDVSGEPLVTDLGLMPHLLIAGATNSGKSVMINSLLLSLVYRNSPSNLKLILVDPKQVELSPYRDIPHLLTPIITEPEKCVSALKWAIAEMERRYSLFAEEDNRNIAEYNASNKDNAMPYIVIVIDELADFMMKAAAEVESAIVRLAQKARATGIHLVLATQRPSVNVITGLIKANVPARIAFSTIAQVDSRTIIDVGGAEKLLGRGDMLFLAPSQNIVKPKRIQGVLVDKKEIQGVANFLRSARDPEYNEEVLVQHVSVGTGHFGSFDGTDDTMFNDAMQVVVESGKASASLLQRRLRIGYARAARLIDLLEERGIVSAPDGSRPREVLVRDIDEIMDNEETRGENTV